MNTYKTFQAWRDAANQTMLRSWGISLADCGFSEEDLQLNYKWHQAQNETPQQFCDDWARKHDFSTPDPMTKQDLERTHKAPLGPNAEPCYKDTYTGCEVEAALCVFEFLMDCRKRTDEPDAPAFEKLVSGWFEGVGWGQMRLSSVPIGCYVNRLYNRYVELHGEYEDAYDWEFVPMVVRSLNLNDVMEATAYRPVIEWPDLDRKVADLRRKVEHAETVRIERQVTGNLMERLVTADYHIRIRSEDGVEEFVEGRDLTQNPQEAVTLAFAIDTIVHVDACDSAGQTEGTVMLVYGNSGWDLLADWAASGDLERLFADVSDFAASLEKA